jgi:hypothetical protein
MKTLEQEAEEYADYKNDYVPLSYFTKFNETLKNAFIAGANSKYVEKKILEIELKAYKDSYNAGNDDDYFEGVIDSLKEKLKQLEQ